MPDLSPGWLFTDNEISPDLLHRLVDQAQIGQFLISSKLVSGVDFLNLSSPAGAVDGDQFLNLTDQWMVRFGGAFSEFTLPTVIVTLTNSSGTQMTAGDAVILRYNFPGEFTRPQGAIFTPTTLPRLRHINTAIGVLVENVANGFDSRVAVAGLVTASVYRGNANPEDQAASTLTAGAWLRLSESTAPALITTIHTLAAYHSYDPVPDGVVLGGAQRNYGMAYVGQLLENVPSGAATATSLRRVFLWK